MIYIRSAKGEMLLPDEESSDPIACSAYRFTCCLNSKYGKRSDVDDRSKSKAGLHLASCGYGIVSIQGPSRES